MAGEMIASAVVMEVISKLANCIWDRLKLSWDFKQDLEDMKITLSTLQAVLPDAEKRSIRNGALCLWLKELKAAAYDIEDMLNDCPSEDNPNQEVSNDRPKKVRRISVYNRDYMARKMKEMRERLDKIAARRSKFHLKEELASNMQDEITKRESCSAIDESMVPYGRDEEKEFIVNLLLDAKGEENISVIPIVGIGGLGKTTLAQLAFNDRRVGVFDLKIWVYVSMEFDLKRIGKSILSDAGEACNLDILQPISRRVREILAGKRYLLVLDDMWTEKEDDWERLKSILRDGSKGSKIIVTTRSQKVASMIGTTHSTTRTTHSVELASIPPYFASIFPRFLLPLHENDSWDLFEWKAFRSRGVNVDPSLKQIGKEIAKKCGGIPLIINAIASKICTKRGTETWSDVRDCEIWELEKDEYKFLCDEKDGKDEKVLSSLRLSYYHMPLHLRPCFAYCSLFPRGHKIDKDKLIQQWISLDLIQRAAWSSSLEVGDIYVNKLLSMSFFQDKNEERYKVTYKMHDLVYNLARSVAGDEVLILNPGQRIRGAEWCRFVTLTGDGKPPNLQAPLLRRVRALHFSSSCGTRLRDDIFLRAECLRVLSISESLNDNLPSSVYELTRLRYLDISYLRIQTLDKSIKNLQNLQVLNLSCCSLKEIPESIGMLQKLHILNLAGCRKLQKLPISIGNLKNLQTLNLLHCSRLRELPLSIRNLQNLEILPRDVT